MIDYGYEDRLVDRIAAREAIAERLTPRQRHVLSRCYHYGETYREVAARDGVSATRINQIHDSAVRLLRRGFADQPKLASANPQQTTRDTPPPGFDKADFLRHMRLLIWLREQHNSPSYAPPPLPTKDELCAKAHEALRYLLVARPQQYLGNPWLGKWCTSVVFTRDGGEASEAVNNIVRELPAHARLSAYPVPIEDGTLGAHATTPYASLRVTVTPDGLKLRFDVTWD